jgi:hypothetical protein
VLHEGEPKEPVSRHRGHVVLHPASGEAEHGVELVLRKSNDRVVEDDGA